MKDESLHPSREDLFAYRDGELPHEKRVVVEAHVMGCGNCRSLIDEVSSLEAELRRAPDGAPADYFERLPDSVRARIAASVEAAPARSPRIERRRVEDSKHPRREGSVGAAPKLPWAAVFSTASAAAAVVVVAVILVNRGAFRRAASPLPPPAAEVDRSGERQNRSVTPENREMTRVSGVEEAPAPGSSAVGMVSANAPVTETAKSRADVAAESKSKALDKDKLAAGGKDEAKKDEAKKDEADLKVGVRPEAVLKRDLTTRQMAAQEAPATSAARVQSMAAPAQGMAEEKAAANEYDAAVRELGLPPVWDDRVSPDALRRAEPRLRLFYQLGKAGSDSARVRLYLAEAARLRYMPGDSTLYEQITHHYLRAIRLAGSDSEVARLSAERLKTLER